MKKQAEQQLLKDGQRIREQAEKRLQSIEFQHRLSSHIHNQTAPNRPNNNYFGLAAAVCFSVLLGSWLMNNQSVNENTNSRIATITVPIASKVSEIPMTIEQTINQTLLNEQQAIINDFKTLQQQLLSI